MLNKNSKIILLLLLLPIIFTLTGCNKDDTSLAGPKDTSKEGTTSLAEDEDDIQVIRASHTINGDTRYLDESSKISDILYGIFIEDINFAIDGGLYAELIKNRSFEYGPSAANVNRHGWINTNPDVLEFDIVDGSSDETYLNENNPTYARLTNSSSSYEGISNLGYLDGLAVREGEPYNFSIYLKTSSSYKGPVKVSLRSKDGTIYAEGNINNITDSWQKYEILLTPNETVNKDLLLVVEITKGSIDLDMVSLMPAETFHGLNIRKDIGQYIKDLNPSFIRFPGGCVVEGRDLESIYGWKDSIGNGLEFIINDKTSVGDVAARPQGKSIWSGNKTDPYYTTYGIGFYEYFLLCEAVDAIPIPVLNAGMTCPIQSSRYIVYPINSKEFRTYVQDALDLVEFCLGGEDTYWGRVRIAMGHEEVFDLKYIGIGNEQWQPEYFDHYEAFVEAFEEAARERPDLYGHIELIIANGPSSASREGWQYIDRHIDDTMTSLVDEHYYEPPTWFLTNTTRYDAYDRDLSADVFLGEYAAKANNLEAALAEAAFMTGIERNSDIVKLACYAPLFGNGKHNQWLPDLMFFSNDSIYGSINYYVQQMYGNNLGSHILPSNLSIEKIGVSDDLSGYVGLGTWRTSAAFDNISVVSNETGKVLYSSEFENDNLLKDDKWVYHEGDWEVKDGSLIQTYIGEPNDTNTGETVYIGDPNWSNYTLTVDAKILKGDEGFLIPIAVQDTGNNIFWNIGGWNNTVSCLQIVSGASKSDQIAGTVKNLRLKHNQVYQLKVVVDGLNIKCYIDDVLYVDYTRTMPAPLYETTSIDNNGDIIIKYVNVTDKDIDIDIVTDWLDLKMYEDRAIATILSGDNLATLNSFDESTNIKPVEKELDIGDDLSYRAPSYSVSIIRLIAK
ncbi:MAG: hypothetical protein GX323_07665 [Clostridiales bacterium]|nr:hypothetical protein [Clostridiales bacterium]